MNEDSTSEAGGEWVEVDTLPFFGGDGVTDPTTQFRGEAPPGWFKLETGQFKTFNNGPGHSIKYPETMTAETPRPLSPPGWVYCSGGFFMAVDDYYGKKDYNELRAGWL